VVQSATLALPALPWAVFAAWAAALSCVALGLRRQRRLRRLEPPECVVLLRDLLGDLHAHDGPNELGQIAERTQRMAIAELNQRLHDVSFELGLLPATFTALVRISLAAGSSCALLGFVAAGSDPAMTRALQFFCAIFGGALGAATVAAIGRMAKSQAALIRERWDSSSRVVGKALGTRVA
jgi:hypothetical protein